MVENRYEKYKKIFRENNGILRVSTAIRLGIPLYVIYSLHKVGDLVKEGNGLYRLTEMDDLGNPDLVQISLRVPKSVICLISALYHHELTTQIPHKIYIALPRNTKTPKIDYPPLQAFHFSEKSYSTGVQSHVIDGVDVKIYSKEKTIADCFKFREKIGMDIAIESLKDYLKQPKPQLHLLVEFSKVNKVENIMRPYLESLV